MLEDIIKRYGLKGVYLNNKMNTHTQYKLS
jgi:hypothetical protein